MKRKIALALVAGTILSSGGGAYAYTTAPVAYVSMDINPSVELGVNIFDKVVSVEAYNNDGKKIIEDSDLRNYPIGNAISKLVSNAISDGYIKEDGSSAIEITTSTDKENVASKLEESLKEAADETLNENDVEANIETKDVALARRDEARKLGITPGKLNLIQKLQELDPTITVEDYKDSSVKDIQKKTIELRKDNKREETTTDSNINSDVVIEENSDPSNNKDNKANNGNDKKEENSNANKEKNNETTIIEKKNNSNNANSQGNNSLKSQNNSDNSNFSKSENSNNANSNSQNKDKAKIVN